ncbi:hypothetical protein OE88DRAFT_1486547 [Heliocybe sulcata]|uniref:Transferase-domain-containing protein n=1 Tax=Heliocybe sulcata TaxID=5364 RepID=A0A5C3N4K5_9AGAM|nr:hypothetical protein OE88DRAFT_1486547 [Heliocybe sulcata]
MSTHVESAAAPHRVRVTERHTLQCANKTTLAELESPVRLGPLDQLVPPNIPIAVVYVYKTPTSSPSVAALSRELIPVERLRRAGSLLLDYYPHLTGRLHLNADGTREIKRLGTGAVLFTAECSAHLDESYSSPDDSPCTQSRIVITDLPDGGQALLAPFDSTVEGVCNHPVFSIQHTRFACGSIALGFRILHTICDADGFFQLVRDLAELYRSLRASESEADTSPGTGVAALDSPPHFQSYLSEPMTEAERQSALEFQPSLYDVGPSPEDAMAALIPAPTALPPPPPVVGRIVRFSGRELDALKAHATPSDAGGWVSTFEALSAHLYQSVYRARLQLRISQGMSPSAAASEIIRDFLTPVNIRDPTRLNLPPRYFPNALSSYCTTLSHEMLADGPLWKVAKAMHDLVRASSQQEAEQIARWIAAQPDKNRIQLRLRYGYGCTMISQWCKFDMYAGAVLDVAPALVSQPFTPISLIDGLFYLLATEEQVQPADSQLRDKGSVDIALALSEPLWPILDQDEQFRRFRRL